MFDLKSGDEPSCVIAISSLNQASVYTSHCVQKVYAMNAENLALCRFYRKPPGDQKPLSYSEIAKLVKKEDGTHPTK